MINAADADNLRLYAEDTGILLHNRNINNLVGNARTYPESYLNGLQHSAIN